MIQTVTWPVMKKAVQDAAGLDRRRYVTLPKKYLLYSILGTIQLECILERPSKWAIDFEENYLASFNTDTIVPGQITESNGVLNFSDNETGGITLKKLKKESSCAVDLENVDQQLSGSDWTLIQAARSIWDLNSDFNMESSRFTPPFEGIYLFDYGVKITSITGVSRIDIGLFESDDLWFVVGSQRIASLQTEVLIANAVNCDMYIGDVFDLRIKLIPTSGLITPTAVIDGDDDYTAWGFGLTHLL